MPFYVIYARTLDSNGNQAAIAPGSIERIILEHNGAEHEVMLELQNEQVLSPGVEYGIKPLQARGATSVVCIQHKALPPGVEDAEGGEFDLLGAAEGESSSGGDRDEVDLL
jgi:hypothetical protein